MNVFKYILAFALVLSFMGCEKKQSSGYHNVHFDRDMCAECRMVVSDRNYVAQIVHVEKNEAYSFDDIGCLFLWMKANEKAWFKSAKIYVSDVDSTKMLDATKAFWSTGHTTPMDFGLAAHERKPEGELIGFEAAKKIALTPKKEKSLQMKCAAGKCGAGKCGGK